MVGILRNALGQVGGRDEGGIRDDLDLGGNQAAALGQHIYFGLANRAIQRVELAVNVGDTHVVQIDQREFADARAGERLDRPATHAANPNHHHMGTAKCLRRTLAVKAPNTAKAEVIIARGSRGFIQ